MSSSKGKPTDPKLREKVKEEVKQKPNKDGGGKGQMAAWKVCSRDIYTCDIAELNLTRAGCRNLEGVREAGWWLRERSWQQERAQEGRTRSQV